MRRSNLICGFRGKAEHADNCAYVILEPKKMSISLPLSLWTRMIRVIHVSFDGVHLFVNSKKRLTILSDWMLPKTMRVKRSSRPAASLYH